jgi:replicative DNA helicase
MVELVRTQQEAAVNGDGEKSETLEVAAEPAPDAVPSPTPGSAPEGVGRELGAILDEALDRMERRVVGDERPIPLPWSNVAAALGGGLWGGTLVTLVGDTGSGKTQWALQLSVHAAENGVPVCYVGPDSGVDQIAARLLALKSGQKWSDLYAGRSDKETLDTLRMGYAQAMKALPFHIIGRSARRDQPYDVRGTAEWMRRKYLEAKPGTRPFLMVLDFVQIASGMSHDETKEIMVRTAHEAHQAAKDFGCVVLLVSTTLRETRADGDETIGIHRDRRRPAKLGRGNPARLVMGGKEEGEVERESDTVIVLAQEVWRGPQDPRSWTKVWCAVAKNRAGTRAWCALRFNGSWFETDLDSTVPAIGEAGGAEDDERPGREEE